MLTELYNSLKNKVQTLMVDNAPNTASTTPAAEPLTPEVVARAPHNTEDLLLPADPKVKEYLDKLVTEREQSKLREKTLREAHQAAEKKLADLQSAKEAQERAALEEQGKFKELYEQAQRTVLEMTAREQLQAVKSALTAELTKQGAVDPDIAQLVLQSHKDVLQYKDGTVFGVAEVVEQYKQQKPAFFKAADAQPGTPPSFATAAPAATGLRTSAPPPAGTPSNNFSDKAIPMKDVDAAWKDLVAGLGNHRR